MKSNYHPHPADRLAAARDASQLVEHTLPVDWPDYWTGVSNPWLMFLGPSPGNSPGRLSATSGNRPPTLGVPHPHLARYEDSNGFWNRIRDWTHQSFLLAGVFQEPVDSLSSVLVGNLLATSAGDSKKLELSALIASIPSASRIILSLQPRIVVTMDKRISGPLVKMLTQQGMTLSSSQRQQVPAKNQSYEYYRPHSWDLADSQIKIRVIESPQHPTKHNFYDAAVMDTFLAAHIRDVLAQ